ncbi:MAG: hypothetical protein NUW37_05320, partial [Planctomycetes bacterium]|nr:hypothetical protein [Planctomycetota bacterium]
MTKQTQKNDRTPGFAAFIDVWDSTYVWNQSSSIAEEIIRALKEQVFSLLEKTGGKFGNFTGDGFLLIFDSAEGSIQFLARTILDWEKKRQEFRKKLAIWPSDLSLALRTGVAFGNYKEIGGWDFPAFIGSTLAMAQRCESFGKEHFGEEDKLASDLDVLLRIFIHQNVYQFVDPRMDYHFKQFDATLKGFDHVSDGNITSTNDHVWAVWPKKIPVQAVSDTKPDEAAIQRLQKFAEAQRKFDLALSLQKAAKGKRGGEQKPLLEQAIQSYREALKVYTLIDSPAYYATTQNNLGNALSNQANLLAGGARARRLDEAVTAYGEALKVRTLADSPADYAMTQNNLGTALWDQAGLLSGDLRARKLEEAVSAYREALKV